MIAANDPGGALEKLVGSKSKKRVAKFTFGGFVGVAIWYMSRRVRESGMSPAMAGTLAGGITNGVAEGAVKIGRGIEWVTRPLRPSVRFFSRFAEARVLVQVGVMPAKFGELQEQLLLLDYVKTWRTPSEHQISAESVEDQNDQKSENETPQSAATLDDQGTVERNNQKSANELLAQEVSATEQTKTVKNKKDVTPEKAEETAQGDLMTVAVAAPQPDPNRAVLVNGKEHHRSASSKRANAKTKRQAA